MKSPKRFLVLEDSPTDAQLLRMRLCKEWPDCEIVETTNETDFVAALKEKRFDVILSDYFIPGFHGLFALAVAREHYSEIPFLFVTGAIGDEVAVESLKAGATDYVLKDRMVRLVPAITRALNEAEESGMRRIAEEKLRQSEEQYRDLFENAIDLIQIVAPDGRFLYVNRAWREALGYAENEVAGLTIFDVVHPEYHEECRQRFQPDKRAKETGPWEAIFLTKYGQHLYVEGNTGARVVSGRVMAARGIFRDVTERKLAAVALKRSNRQYEELVNAIDGIVWQAEFPSLRFTFVSEQAERLLGYPPEWWLEKPDFWQEHIHPDDQQAAVKHCTSISGEEGHKSFEYRMVAADGRVVWLRDLASVQLEKDKPAVIQGIMVDITDRKQAEEGRRESEALKGAIMEAALDCIVVMNEEGEVIEFNPTAEKTFGYTRAEMLGRPLVEKIVPPAMRERHLRLLTKFLRTRKGRLGKRIEMTAMRVDGCEFPVELAVVPIQLGERAVFTAYLRDITERKEAEKKMRRIRVRLEQTNRDLRGKNKEIQNFYHTLSHELKTPLTSAGEFISIVMDGLAGPLNHTQMEYLGIARQSCNQLRFCINDLLDATRLETGKLAIELKRASLVPIIERVLTTMRSRAKEKAITLTQELRPDLGYAPLDEYRMTQVISNLLGNAIKYTPPGGAVMIKAGDAPGRPEFIQVSVKDTGCGVPKEEQERIFDRLYQVKSGDATTEQGVGLGLYLCRELVQLHGGEIRVESQLGKGSTFSFVLPKNGPAPCANPVRETIPARHHSGEPDVWIRNNLPRTRPVRAA